MGTHGKQERLKCAPIDYRLNMNPPNPLLRCIILINRIAYRCSLTLEPIISDLGIQDREVTRVEEDLDGTLRIIIDHLCNSVQRHIVCQIT